MATNAIYREHIRFQNAQRFVHDYRLDNSETGVLTNDNHLYIFIGREIDPQGEDPSGSAYAPGAGVWPNSDQDVGTPVQTTLVDKEFWSLAIGAQKIDTKDVCLVVPRRDWTTGTNYVVRPENTTSSFDQAFYVMNSLNEVFVVVAKTSPGNLSTVEPTLAAAVGVDSTFFKDGKQSILVSGTDGYTWKYLYKMTPYLVNAILETEWMPVPMDDNFWTAGQPERTRGRDDAYLHVGARWVLIRGLLEAGIDGSGKLPANLSYRQVMFVANPLLNDPDLTVETRATAGTYFQRNTVNGGTLPADDELRKNSGSIIYLEDRNAVFRQVNQTEEIKTILVF